MSNANMHLSGKGGQFIAGFEGNVLHPYNDPLNATIGIGHLIHYGKFTDADVRKYRNFSYADSIRLLQADVGAAQVAIRKYITRELTQPEWDAIVSAVFNCGAGVIVGTVGKLINAGQLQAAMQALQAWDHAGGVVVTGLARRRKAEAELFLSKPSAPLYWGPGELNWIKEYDRLLHENKNLPRRRFLRAQMGKRANAIGVAAAHHGGWKILNRRNRYHSLHARS